MNVKLDYDPRANAASLRFSDNAVLESSEISSGIVADFDSDGKIVGLEFLDASRILPGEALRTERSIRT